MHGTDDSKTDDAQLHSQKRLADQLDQLAKKCAALPVLDERQPDEILAYDEDGLPS